MVIADNQRDGAVQLAGLMSVKNIHQAVKVLRHEAGDTGGFRHQMESPMHVKLGCGVLKFRLECGLIESFQRPFDAHKKKTGFMVLMLIGVRDVGAVSIEQAGDRRHQAFTVRAVDQENGGILHRAELD
jgi:hypothetical protein